MTLINKPFITKYRIYTKLFGKDIQHPQYNSLLYQEHIRLRNKFLIRAKLVIQPTNLDLIIIQTTPEITHIENSDPDKGTVLEYEAITTKQTPIRQEEGEDIDEWAVPYGIDEWAVPHDIDEWAIPYGTDKWAVS